MIRNKKRKWLFIKICNEKNGNFTRLRTRLRLKKHSEKQQKICFEVSNFRFWINVPNVWLKNRVFFQDFGKASSQFFQRKSLLFFNFLNIFKNIFAWELSVLFENSNFCFRILIFARKNLVSARTYLILSSKIQKCFA